MTFSDAVAQMPDAIRLRVLWLTIAMFATPLVLLALPGSRREGVLVLVSSVLVVVAMQALYGACGCLACRISPSGRRWPSTSIDGSAQARCAPGPDRRVDLLRDDHHFARLRLHRRCTVPCGGPGADGGGARRVEALSPLRRW